MAGTSGLAAAIIIGATRPERAGKIKKTLSEVSVGR
jgi:hypothetical protein